MNQNSKYFLKGKKIIGIGILLLSVNISYGQSKIEQLDELLNLYTEYGQFNGSVLVAEKSKILYCNHFIIPNYLKINFSN